MEMEIKKLKAAKGLLLALAIVNVVFAVPLIGYLLTLVSYGVLALLTLALAIVTLVFCVRAKVAKVGTIFAIITNTLGFISGIIMIYGSKDIEAINATNADAILNMMEAGELNLFFIGFMLGLLVWICYVVTAIVLFVNYAKTRTQQKTLELEVYTPISYGINAKEELSSFNQSDYQQPDLQAEYNKTDVADTTAEAATDTQDTDKSM